ncbi:cyclin-like protein [Dendryphion nanum]|uniref:Cyclin-like protein n=1 Tax=Dendryphion nanum TaxID=256645 RepID=A0A9P9D3M0_9PLEO|nr:cyclin-like protein [Dendryphion nanum]
MPSGEDEYADEIFEHQRQVEIKLAPDLEDADLQIELRENREALVGWLIEVHDQYFRQYGSPMVFLTNNIVDRFLSHRRVHTDRLQLVGITALYMAHKFENGVEETLSDLKYMCNEKYTTDQIARAERFMLYTLDYRLAWPGPLPFLERISKASQESSLTKKVAEYVLEATTVNYACVLKLPSLIAATAFFLAQSLLGNCNWTPGQEESSGYQYSQLYPHMRKFLHWM